MSQPPPAPANRPGRQPSYQRSTSGMVAAMIVIVVVVLGWVLFRAVTSDKPETPVRTVEWTSWVSAARQDGALAVLAPERLPEGWRATSAKYDAGMAPQWRLGMLTEDGRFVGLVQSRATVDDLVAAHVDENAEQGPDVEIAGHTWQSWSDSGGDYGLSRTVEHGQLVDAVLVYGSAPEKQIRDFAASLR